MAIRANHPWTYNYLQLPFYTGDRFKFLPFNMYPGHRGYGAVGGSQGILPQNMLQQFVPLLNSLFGNIKFGAVRTKKSAAVPPVRDYILVKDPLSLKALLSKIVKSPASKYIAPGVAASGLAAWVLGPRVQEALRSNPPSAPVPPESIKLLGVDVPKDPSILLHPLSYHPVLSGAALGGLLGSIYLTSKHKKKYKSLGERLTSPEMFYGLAAGGLSGAALGAAIHNYAKFMRGE